MRRDPCPLAFLLSVGLSISATAVGRVPPPRDTSRLLANPRLSPEAQKHIRDRIDAVHAEFRASHGGLGPEQFGVECCQIMQIPAAAFTSTFPGTGWVVDFDSYFKPPGASLYASPWAPVQLPSGAEIRYLDLYYYDADPTLDIRADLTALAGGGLLSGPPSSSNLATAESSGGPGYGYQPSPLFSYTVNNNVGYDPAAAQLVVSVSTSPAAGLDLGFKAVDLWWMRQVSPAPATPTFNDVSPGDFGFQHIEALEASGITAGCGGGNFCPNASLTRAQMAVFLAKAPGLYWKY